MTGLIPAGFAIAFIGVFGLLIGSFLNVVVWRVPQGMSTVRPPSACPSCGAGIAWYDNIPVLSYLLLRGKCRNCGAHISIRYPLVELGTGLAFAALTWAVYAGVVAEQVLPLLLFWAAISIALALIDLDHKRLPDVIVLPSYVVTAVLLVLAAVLSDDSAPLLTASFGAVAMLALYLALALGYRGGMGWGDVKLAGVLGLVLGWFGWGAVIVGAFSAFVVGGLVGIAVMLTGRGTRKSAIPFGPFMLLGAWVGIFLGAPIAQLYLTIAGLA